jgi:hypothetical protein
MSHAYGQLLGIEEAGALILAGGDRCFAICGDEAMLARLPRGRWVGGTIPYFMAEDLGGTVSRRHVLVAELPTFGRAATIRSYDRDALARIPRDAPANGYSFLILPAFSDAHLEFAKSAPYYPDLFLKPLFGWVSGIHLDDLGAVAPKVFAGDTGTTFTDRAVVLHVELPPDKVAVVDILNIFEPADGTVIAFPSTGFSAQDCTIDGHPENFARWCERMQIDSRLPLVADYCGANVNVCIREVDAAKGEVSFYAPVFDGVQYRFAKPVPDYPAAFAAAMASLPASAPFACNCILNFLYGGLEGHLAGMPGPVTFGEVAYQLLNQTMVYFDIHDA